VLVSGARTITCRDVCLLSDEGADGLVYEGRSDDYYDVQGVAARLVIKECYPLGAVSSLARVGDALVMSDGAPVSDMAAFARCAKRFGDAFVHQVKLFVEAAPEHTAVPVGVYEANSTVYTISEIPCGVTFDKAVARGLPLAAALRALALLCEVLDRYHQQGFLYLGLKPSNILLTSCGGDSAGSFTEGVRLFEFDTVVKAENVSDPDTLISASGNWSAPEQSFARMGEVSRASDGYSIGAILFWLVTGYPPASDEVIHACGKWGLPRGAVRHPGLKGADARAMDAICRILDKTLVCAPEDRCHNIGLLAADLRDLAGHKAASAPRYAL
jgi:hypothetical protein